jgi:hypothetical protein
MSYAENIAEHVLLTVSIITFLSLTMALVGFLHPVGTFGRLIAPYLLCTGISMMVAISIGYLGTVTQIWIAGCDDKTF